MSSQPSRLVLSDLEADQQVHDRQASAAAAVLEQVGALLQQADAQLSAWEDDDVLGTAIYRASQDLAGAVGNLAHQLEQQDDEQREALAAACLQDMQQHSLYLQENGSDGDNNTMMMRETSDDLAQMNKHDFVQVLRAVGVFLRDVEASLKAMQLEEAEEVADVALTVGRLFVASLQSAHDQLAPEDLLRMTEPSTTTNRSSVTIEVLEEDDHQNQYESKSRSFDPTQPKTLSRQNNKTKQKERRDRLRVLWPPLGPEVQKACAWGQQAAADQPLLAVALGFVLWPAAVVSAFVGPPLLLADHVLQDVYHNFQEGPLISNLERGAAQLYQTARLALVSSKLLSRQGLRIAQRQVDRHGGLPQICQNVVAYGVDRVTHPVQTVGMVWDGLCWTKDRVCETIDQFQDQERDPMVVQLQQ